MAVRNNTITREDTVAAIEQEFIESFTHEYDRLEETLGLFGVETVAAGTALYKYSIAGSLNNSATEDSSSGTAYVEGDQIALSKYTVTKTPIGEVEFVPYAKQTTAQAILKGGFQNAIARTDRKAIRELRGDVMTKFFQFLPEGTTVADPDSGTWNLQQMLAKTEAALLNKLEDNNDEGGTIVHFVNRSDAYDYLADANIVTQDMFGMTYLQNFLGVQNVMLTNRVAAGTCYATPVENIHVYGIDYGTLSDSDISYETDAMGLVGIHHEGNYGYASAMTYLVRSVTFLPEITDFIAKGFAAHQA